MSHVDSVPRERALAELVRALAAACGAHALASSPEWCAAHARTIEERRLAGTGAPIYLFIGERQSLRAWAAGATWYDGHFAARTLRDALAWAGVDPARQLYTNLWRAPGRGRPEHDDEPHLDLVRRAAAADLVVVALGHRVAATLTAAHIPHLAAPHPARQGPTRARDVYRCDLAAGLGIAPTVPRHDARPRL